MSVSQYRRLTSAASRSSITCASGARGRHLQDKTAAARSPVKPRRRGERRLMARDRRLPTYRDPTMWAVVAAALIFQVQVHVNVPGDPRPDSVIAVQDTLRPLPDSATLATAYLDPDARVMVERARLWRDSVDRAIESYEAIVREHISAGLRAFRRDRVLYRRE